MRSLSMGRQTKTKLNCRKTNAMILLASLSILLLAFGTAEIFRAIEA